MFPIVAKQRRKIFSAENFLVLLDHTGFAAQNAKSLAVSVFPAIMTNTLLITMSAKNSLETNQRLGTQLSSEDQRYVLSSFIFRSTKNTPYPKYVGAGPIQFASDQEWLAHTRFYVTQTGKLDKRRKFCESYPTWPDNPELRK